MTDVLVHEHDGALWKALPGTISSFEELINAQRRWMEIFEEVGWNPWSEAALEEEREHAVRVMQEWTRAEPDFRPMTRRQVAAMSAAVTRKVRKQRAADEARWERDRARHDPGRERARLTLLEREAVVGARRHELGAYKSGERFPAMPVDKRTTQIAELERQLEDEGREITRLREVVGDPEDVVDQDGKLPRDRRIINLLWYGIRRRQRVVELQRTVPELRAEAKGAPRDERSRLQARLHFDERELASLLRVPILKADDMCADCWTPSFQQGYGNVEDFRPCPAWPGWAARFEKVREILRSAVPKAVEPAPVVKPQPIATLAGGLPVADVIAQLTQLQGEHPTAVVKRGRANQWELWPDESGGR